MPSRGLYQSLITEELETTLRAVANDLHVSRSRVHVEEIADRLAFHISRVLEKHVSGFSKETRLEEASELARELVAVMARSNESIAILSERPTTPPELLAAVTLALPDGRPEVIAEPGISLLDTALLTNAPGEPRLGHQIVSEIDSADRIDVVMAFIRLSGIRPLLDALEKHCLAGRPLRVLTTTYTQTTELRALQRLQKLGAEVLVSYDVTGTRLHAKAWLFHRLSGFPTAYLGSSNLTHSAQVTGLEWNVRVSGARNPSVVEKMTAVFESYWNSGDFSIFDESEFQAKVVVQNGEENRQLLSPFELRPRPFQERLLEQLAISRRNGSHRNLLVAATGTGKTVMAALDYLSLRETLPRTRLLFVAHRKEILTQAINTFRQAIRDYDFGELWVDGKHPNRFDYVFASIQSLNASGIDRIPRDHFDVIIVDEFHHAAADSYQALLDGLRPKELLGLTATPERSDGLPILKWFDGQIAAELRLWDAIDQHQLVPFTYYGIHDGIDYRQVAWRRGQGYDLSEVAALYLAHADWIKQVLEQVIDRVDDPLRMRALGFCVSVEHARHMARYFCEARIPAVAIWGDSAAADREAALRDLRDRRVNVVFSVDLFNEGVDVPAVDTLLFLRPTDSPTLFLQQLGRGLRRHVHKTTCTVLDFVGQHRREFRFDRRFAALLMGSRHQVIKQIEQGFPLLPAGCHLELDQKAREIVLSNIKSAVSSRWDQKVNDLRAFASRSPVVELGAFLDETGLSLEDIYKNKKGWSDLLLAAGLNVLPEGPREDDLGGAIGRLLHVDDSLRIEAWRRFLSAPDVPVVEDLSTRDLRLLRMLIESTAGSLQGVTLSLQEAAQFLWAHPQRRVELVSVLGVLDRRRSHLGHPLSGHPEIPLQVHARYSRIEILAAFGVSQVHSWREGVYWAKGARADIFAFTADKTSKHFSPTTRYRDYAINRDLLHWESQSTTPHSSPTGQRYINHAALGSHVMVFGRERSDDRAFYFLGPASYVSHQGEKPMSITWRLQTPLSGDLFSAFAVAL